MPPAVPPPPPPPKPPPPATARPTDRLAGANIPAGSSQMCIANDDCSRFTGAQCGCRTVDGDDCYFKHCCAILGGSCITEIDCCVGGSCNTAATAGPSGTCQ